MATSRFGLTGRILAGIAAAALLAGVSLDAAAYGSSGRIVLETGKDLSAFLYRFQTFSETSLTSGWTDQAMAHFQVDKGCKIVPKEGDDDLVNLLAFGPGDDTKLGALGFVATSIGVYDGPQGTACGRVSASKDEALMFNLGSYFPDNPQFNVNAFDYIEMDVEVKGDVHLTLEIEFDGRKHTYHLFAGSMVTGSVDREDTVLKWGVKEYYNCSAATDSGADAGPKDNCRWRIEDIGRSFKITAVQGEFSLEGGGDHPTPGANRTLVYLTEADGILDCGQNIEATDEDAGMRCSITRLDPYPQPEGTPSTCVAIPYVFRSSGGECTLTADTFGQQLVANLYVEYPQENATSQASTWPAAKLSRVKFANQPVSPPDFAIPACRGVTIRDEDDVVGPDPFPEVQATLGTGANTYDWFDTTPDDFIEYACVWERTESFSGDDEALKTKIYEWIQFWGDINFARNVE